MTEHKYIDHLLNRAERDKQDGDFSYFWSLLLAGEALHKLVVLGMVSAVGDDRERNRYRLQYRLVRAQGLGEWNDVLGEVLNGPPSQYLHPDLSVERDQLTKRNPDDAWQAECVDLLRQCLSQLDIEQRQTERGSPLISWFRLFALLRNKTRGHGATRTTVSGLAGKCLNDSIRVLYGNLKLFHRPWAHLHQNINGRYRVTGIGGDATVYDYLKYESSHNLADGVYMYVDVPMQLELVVGEPDGRDFFLPNGNFNKHHYELLSYVSDDRISGDSLQFTQSPHMRISRTHGNEALLIRGNSLTNAPKSAEDYVARPDIEHRLLDLLTDDRHPIITLQGTGGIGKTSTTLTIIDKIADQDRFELIAWFSARDIDLDYAGARPVKPSVVTENDISDRYAQLVLSRDVINDRKFDRRMFFEQQLASYDGDDSCLFIFDNFETVRNPVEMFDSIERNVRLPNKVLITTRLRDFKGDYPIEVYGMTDDQAEDLIRKTASRLGIWGLLDENKVADLAKSSGGHPYVIKILLGEVVDSRRFSSPRHVIARSDEILTALFERTFRALSPCGQRIFMTLAAWNSAVPRVALEAVLIGSTNDNYEVDMAIESLLNYSFAEQHVAAEDGQTFISLPLTAHAFGKKKLETSILKSAIETDVQILQMFSPSTISDINLNLDRRLRSFINNVSSQIDRGEPFSRFEPILHMVCRSYNPGWLQLARWRIERGTAADLDLAISDIETFIQNDDNGPSSAIAWRMLAEIYGKKQDIFGEINALVERSMLDSVPFHDISNTANFLNQIYRELDIDQGRLVLVERLLEVLEKRSDEANANDFSRMAWLAMHLLKEEHAKEFVERGLKLDPSNVHCIRIANRPIFSV